MPYAPPSICPACKRIKGRDCTCTAKRVEDRADATQRGYDRKWKKFRLRYMAENPLCVDCEQRGKVRAAEHIHHVEKLVDRPELKYEADNLMALCERCHNARTAKGE